MSETFDDVAGEINAGELQRRDIEGDAYRMEAFVLPFPALPATLVKYPVTERHDETAFFRDRNEAVRVDQAEHRMVQAHQGLQAAQLTIPCVERLIVQSSEPADPSEHGEGASQLGGFEGCSRNLLRDMHVLVAAGFLGAVHRRIGIAPQQRRISAMVRVNGDAQAGSEIISIPL